MLHGLPRSLSSEAKTLWQTALAHGGLDKPGLPPGSEQAFADLIDIGLLVRDPAGVDRFVAVDPQHLITRLTSRAQAEAAELLTWASGLPTELKDLREAYLAGGGSHVGSPTEYVSGIPAINQRLDALVEGARDELLTAQPGGARPPDILKEAVLRDMPALQRGVRMRTLYQASARSDRGTRAYVQAIQKEGPAQVRTLDEFFPRLIVIDRETAVYPVEGETATAAFCRDRAMVGFLVDLFNKHWDRALPMDGDRVKVPDDGSEQVRAAIIRLLRQEETQTAIGRRLGISDRTVARHIKTLYEEAEVDSMFALGWYHGAREHADNCSHESEQFGT